MNESQIVDEIIDKEGRFDVFTAEGQYLTGQKNFAEAVDYCERVMSHFYPSYCRAGNKFYFGSIIDDNCLRMSIEPSEPIPF